MYGTKIVVLDCYEANGWNACGCETPARVSALIVGFSDTRSTDITRHWPHYRLDAVTSINKCHALLLNRHTGIDTCEMTTP